LVNTNDFNRPQQLLAGAARRPSPRRPAYAPYPYAYPGWGYPYPYYYGPSFGVYIGRGRRWR
jgi:hypothetical protein